MKESKSIKLQYRKVEIMYKLKLGIYLVNLLLAFAVSYTFYSEINKNLIISWLIAHLIYLTLRLGSSLYLKSNPKEFETHPRRYEILYMFLSTFGGSLWGFAAYFFLDGASIEQYLSMTAILTGVSAGSIASNSASLQGSLLFLYSIHIPFFSIVLQSNLVEKSFLSSLIIFFIVVLTFCAKYIYDTLYSAIEYRLASERLLQELKSSQELQHAAQGHALQSTKMASIGEMATGFAHEINNPLTIVNGNLVILNKKFSKLDTDIDTDKIFQRCFSSIKKISGIIDSLKMFSKEEIENSEKDKTPANLEEIIKDSTSLMHEKLKIHNIDLRIDLANPYSKISNNKRGLSQAILNLITNSFRIFPSDSFGWIEVKSFQCHEYIYIEINSSNQCLDSSEVERFFDPYYVTSETDPEFGAILSMTKAQIEHYGHELVFNKRDFGSSFTIKIPINSQTYNT